MVSARGHWTEGCLGFIRVKDWMTLSSQAYLEQGKGIRICSLRSREMSVRGRFLSACE